MTALARTTESLADLELPSPPRSLAAIVEAASDPNVPAAKLTNLVAGDPAFSARILTMANSPLYRRGGKTTSVAHAVGVLGSRQLRNIALCAAAQACVKKGQLGSFHLGRFWENSLRRAVACQVLAEAHSELDPMSAFTAGLLQDLGLLALIQLQPHNAKRWMEKERCFPEERRLLEQELFGVSHEQVSAEMAERWRLPAELRDPMRFHHRPVRAPTEQALMCRVSAFAEIIAWVLASDEPRTALERARLQLADEAKMARSEVDRVVEEVSRRVTAAAQALGIRVKGQPSLENISQQAFAGIAKLNLAYEDIIHHLEVSLAEQDRLTRELQDKNNQLEQLARTDVLTSLPNRRAFWQRVSDEIERAQRGSGRRVGLLVIDADHFKRINDTKGHDGGDRVLQHLSEVMQRDIDEHDLLARIGGEEFAVVQGAADEESATSLAARLVERVQNTPCTFTEDEQLPLSISVGVALTPPLQANEDISESGQALYRAADKALYHAKDSGRGRWVAAVSDHNGDTRSGSSSRKWYEGLLGR